eukprot:c23478_g1_i1.p1 GENE.c23478_g1_i1~~c23478_g1_i1.p1  ORF type:complete len:164 (+),score=25.66 c23478_g1_i1:329-820(+)
MLLKLHFHTGGKIHFFPYSKEDKVDETSQRPLSRVCRTPHQRNDTDSIVLQRGAKQHATNPHAQRNEIWTEAWRQYKETSPWGHVICVAQNQEPCNSFGTLILRLSCLVTNFSLVNVNPAIPIICKLLFGPLKSCVFVCLCQSWLGSFCHFSPFMLLHGLPHS